MLIDGGPDPDRILLALDERIPPWDRRLDVLVLTHPHEDHVAGLARILARYSVGRVYEPGMRGPGPGWAAWDAELHDGPPHAALQTGARLRLGEVGLTVLWPDPGAVPLEPPDTGTGINNVSIVFLGEANGRRFLLMGDVEQGIDPTLLARGLPHVDLLKVAHHGSATASTQRVRRCRPAAGRDRVRRGRQPVRAPGEVDPRAPPGERGPGLPDGPGRLGRGGARRGRPHGPRDRRPRRRQRRPSVAGAPPRSCAPSRSARLTGVGPAPARRRRPRSPTGRRRPAGVGLGGPTGYDPLHDDPRSPRGRPPAASLIRRPSSPGTPAPSPTSRPSSRRASRRDRPSTRAWSRRRRCSTTSTSWPRRTRPPTSGMAKVRRPGSRPTATRSSRPWSGTTR